MRHLCRGMRDLPAWGRGRCRAAPGLCGTSPVASQLLVERAENGKSLQVRA